MKALLAACAALMLAGCATVDRVDAGRDVHRFLLAVRDNDRAAFDRYVDRQALVRSMESRLIDGAQDSSLPGPLRTIGSVLAGPASATIGAVVVRPSVFRMIAVSLGYSPSDPIPSGLEIAAILRRVDGDHVCAARSRRDPCLLTFEQQGDVWRLVSIDAPLRDLSL